MKTGVTAVENVALLSQETNLILKCIEIVKSFKLHYFISSYSMFDQINATLVSTRLFKNNNSVHNTILNDSR